MLVAVAALRLLQFQVGHTLRPLSLTLPVVLDGAGHVRGVTECKTNADEGGPGTAGPLEAVRSGGDYRWCKARACRRRSRFRSGPPLDAQGNGRAGSRICQWKLGFVAGLENVRGDGSQLGGDDVVVRGEILKRRTSL